MTTITLSAPDGRTVTAASFGPTDGHVVIHAHGGVQHQCVPGAKLRERLG